MPNGQKGKGWSLTIITSELNYISAMNSQECRLTPIILATWEAEIRRIGFDKKFETYLNCWVRWHRFTQGSSNRRIVVQAGLSTRDLTSKITNKKGPMEWLQQESACLASLRP
jgi:hypothetical protein